MDDSVAGWRWEMSFDAVVARVFEWVRFKYYAVQVWLFDGLREDSAPQIEPRCAECLHGFHGICINSGFPCLAHLLRC